MTRVTFKFKGGQTRAMHKFQADILAKRGLGEYQTRDMADQPMVQKVPVSRTVDAPTDLEAMDREQLHALAKERGVKVHHMAGADKVREALRAAE